MERRGISLFILGGISTIIKKKWYESRGDNMLKSLLMEMIRYYEGDAKRIQHFIKVHAFAKMIGELEQVEKDAMEILEAAAYVHDIGIKTAESKFGKCDGKLQEQEGAAEAKKMLERLGFEDDVIERICYLVGHHHTYTDIDGIDYQILVEADFLVNLYEDHASKEAVAAVYKRIFKTCSGKQLCKIMFKCEEAI